MQHPDDIEYFQRIQRIGFAAAKEYGIRCLVIEAKKRPQTGYGNAYVLEDKICVSVRDKRTKDFGGQWAKHRYSHSDVLHTLAHELAHLAAYQREGKYIGHADKFRKHDAPLQQLVKELDGKIE